MRGRRGARHAGAHLRRRDPRGRRLPRRARAGRHVHRHAERGLRHREQRRRHLSARQRVVAGPAGRHAATCASPTRKGAPPTIPFWLGEAPARSDELSRAVSELRARRRSATARAATATAAMPRSATQPAVAWLARKPASRRAAAEQVVAYLAEARARARRAADAGDARARALLRRVGRHAARAARAVRQPHQQGLGPGAAQALLPPVQLRAAGRGDRGRAAAVARAAALVSARRRLPLSASGDRARRAGAGVARRAGVPDALALEHDDLAGRAAQPRRQEGAAAAAADAWPTI